MNEGKNLRDAVDAVSSDALDEAMSLAFSSGAETTEQPSDESSQIVGRYKLLEQIGEGGFGVVYMAEQQEPIRRRVALKIIKLGMDTKQVVARFEAERQALAMMDHEHIASVLDAGATETGRPYFVMELVRGVPITEYCDRNKLNTRQRLKLFVSVCRAVQHAHQKGIIHRDLKPTNVMVTLRDGEPVPKVIDFGVAKATQARLTEKTVFTRFGQFIGTPAYMSPEQVEMSELDVDTRSDIYSLGVLMYELLTGSTPIRHDLLRRASYSEMQRLICEQDPPSPSSRLSHSGEALATISAQRSTAPEKLGQAVRGDLDWIVMKALEKDRTRRYETANGLAEDVLRFLNDEPVTASPPSTSYRLRKFARKHRRWFAAGTLVAVMLLLSSVVSIGLAYRASLAEDKAQFNEGLANRRLQQEQSARQELEKQRDVAEKLGADLKLQLAATDREITRSRHLLYVAHMNLIHKELDTGNDPRIISLLDHHRPASGQPDLRGFEWYYVWGLCHRYPWSWQHHASVTSIAYSPVDKIVATGSTDGRLQIWNAESGEILSAVNGHANVIADIAFSPDGQMIATASLDGTTRRWTFASGRLDPLGDPTRHAGQVHCVSFSPGGTFLAVGGQLAAGPIMLRNLETGVDRTILSSQSVAVTLSFSRDGSALAFCGFTPLVEIWDVETATRAATIDTGFPVVSAIAYSPVDHTLALGDSQGTVALWNDKSGIRHLGRHSGEIKDLVFSYDGHTVASCGTDQLIAIWDVQRQEKIDMLRGHTAGVNAVAISPDGTALLSASADNTVKLWDLARGGATDHFTAHAGSVGSLACSPTNHQTIASASRDGSVKLWNLDSGEVRETLPPVGGAVHALAFSPDGSTIAYGGGPLDEPSQLRLWNIRRKTLTRTRNEHSRAILAVAYSPDGRTIATGGDDGLLIFWEADTAEVRAKLENNTDAIVAVAFSPDGQLLATSNFRRNEITLWSVSEMRPVGEIEGHQDWVTSLAFSPDGATLASGSVDRTVRTWDVTTGNQQHVMSGHSRRVSSVAYSPDGRTLASAGMDDQLRLWDPMTGQEKAMLECDPDMEGTGLAFSLDGRALVASDQQSLIVHRAATDQDFFFHNPPEKPRNEFPISQVTVAADPVVLVAAPFNHRHSEVEHVASHWQVSTVSGDYTTPVVHGVRSDAIARLTLDRGILLPNTTYYWRVAHVGSNHRTSEFSEESSFTTDEFSMIAVPFDLTTHFNRDIVKNPGDPETDSIDTTAGSHLVVEGFDGDARSNPRVQGLPVDRRLGLHHLGDYGGQNAIQIGLTDEDKSPIRVKVPEDHYRFVRFLVVGGNGNSDMPVRFEFDDGTSSREIIRCDDWFHDLDANRYGMLRDGQLPIINHMDRFYDNQFHDANAPAIFEITLKLDPSKTLSALVLEVDSDDTLFTDTALWPDHTRAKFNLLAATGVKIAP